MPRTTTCVCGECKKTFEKPLGEWKRNENLGRGHFCCLTCAVAHGNHLREGNIANFKGKKAWADGLGPFRYFIRNVRRRFKERPAKKNVSITVEYLREIWEQQQGTCPLTGWKLVLPKDSMGFHDHDRLMQASLDRIDCSKGYERGNVRFVALIGNLCRNTFTDEEVMSFCRAVTKKNPDQRQVGVENKVEMGGIEPPS